MSEDTEGKTSENPPEETEAPETDVTDDDDPVKEAVEAGISAELPKIREQVRLEIEGEYQKNLQTRRQEEELAQLANSFGSTVREVYQNLNKLELYDEDGKRFTFDDNTFQSTIAEPFQKFNQKGFEAAWLQARSAIGEAALKLVPKEEHETFIKAAGGKAPDEWLDTLVNHLAPKSKWAQQVTKDHEAEVKAAEARGIAKGQKMKGAPPSSAEAGGKGSVAINYDSIVSITRARKEGLIDHDEWYKHFKRLSNG